MQHPLISVIMPVYNAENFVKNAIDSILMQTYKNIEIICVNDCSTDNSLKIISETAAVDSRVNIIDSPVNVGAGEARNLGLSAAKGEYITFVDADDTIEPDLYECAVAMTVLNDLDWIHWGMKEEYFDLQGKKTFERNIFLADEILSDPTAMKKAIVKLEDINIFGYQCNSLYRTSIIKDKAVRFNKAILYEDFFFNLDFAKYASTMGILSKTGYCYKKQNSESVTAKYVAEYFELCQKRISGLLNYFENCELADTGTKAVLGRIYLRYIMSALMRNCDDACPMNFRDRKEWIKMLYNDGLYDKLCRNISIQGKVNQILKLLINKKQTFLLLLCGRFIYLVKVKYPSVFLKLKTRP